MKTFPTLVFSIALFALTEGCGGAPTQASPDFPDSGCGRSDLEADFKTTALSGSAVDGGFLVPPAAGTQYLISSTYLQLRKGEVTQNRFNEVMKPISEALPTQDGLLAIQFAVSERCGVARTMVVWRDQPAMYKFVTGAAHQKAINAVGDVSRGGSVVTHWVGTEADFNWNTVRAKFALHTGPEY